MVGYVQCFQSPRERRGQLRSRLSFCSVQQLSLQAHPTRNLLRLPWTSQSKRAFGAFLVCSASCGLLGTGLSNRTEGRAATGALESGLALTVCSLIPDHRASFILAPGSPAAAGLEPAFAAGTCLLCGFHSSPWCLDSKLQEMTVHLFSPLNKERAVVTD